MTNEIFEIPIDEISVSDWNVRRSEQDRDLEELAASIAKHGLLQPVVLIGEHGNPPYQLIIGQRRFLAHRDILHKKKIRSVFAGRLNRVQASIRSLVENMTRTDLNHADAAEAITNLYKQLHRDERKVKAETGLSLQRIRQYVDIDERASPKMKEKLRAKKVTPADVQRVLRAASGDIEKADRLLEKMDRQKLTLYQKKKMVEYGEEHPHAHYDKIIEEAQRPTVERTILVKLSDQARAGLEKAAEKLAMSPDEVAAQAVEDWLSRKGFISA
jgi:ParB family chromosome partitioning protein